MNAMEDYGAGAAGDERPGPSASTDAGVGREPGATKAPRWAGPTKLKRVRDYSAGSVLDGIRASESLEELEEMRVHVSQLAAEGTVSRGTLRKWDRAGALKFKELKGRTIITPPKPRLLVPKHLAKDQLIVKP